jgi:divalent metal cation (Fe/Co/Zn/Cd) transporter
MRLIGAAFFAVAAYIVIQLTLTLTSAVRPAPSPLGLMALAATMVVMLLLAWGKASVGRRLGNPVMIAESRVTLIDAALAGAVFLGVGLNTLFGWWWADPASGLIVVYYAFREGRSAWTHGR